MTKKLRDISIGDIIKICKKYYCDECPIAPYLCLDCSEFRSIKNNDLEDEIEVPENE